MPIVPQSDFCFCNMRNEKQTVRLHDYGSMGQMDNSYGNGGKWKMTPPFVQ